MFARRLEPLRDNQQITKQRHNKQICVRTWVHLEAKVRQS
jgi:hypothetical protein